MHFKKIAVVALLVFAGACTNGPGITSDSELPLMQNLGTLEPGVTYNYRFYIHCGMKWLESFNGMAWVTDEPMYRGTDRPSEDLRQFFTNPDEVISPILRTRITLVGEDEIRVTLPDGSQSSTYHPTGEEWPGCA